MVLVVRVEMQLCDLVFAATPDNRTAKTHRESSLKKLQLAGSNEGSWGVYSAMLGAQKGANLRQLSARKEKRNV
jgi:hypothetical protein